MMALRNKSLWCRAGHQGWQNFIKVSEVDSLAGSRASSHKKSSKDEAEMPALRECRRSEAAAVPWPAAS